jgi:hypothetical protein
MGPALSQPLRQPERDAQDVEENAVRVGSARAIAIRDSWRALWMSRLLVWVVGIAAVGVAGVRSATEAFDPRGLTSGLGVGEALAGPAARWDAAWYLTIAKSGYQPELGARTIARAAFFPAYPLTIRAVGLLGVPLIVGGVLVSLCAFAAGLYGIHRLTTLEFKRTEPVDDRPEQVARLAVLVMAFTPMALFFSAIYTESLFLALSVALFWSARHGRWAWVGVVGALAVATRSTGLVLAVPALVLYLYGPREDRPPDRLAAGPVRAADGVIAYARHAVGLLRPRYRLRPQVLWLALLPTAVVIFAGSLALSGGDALAPFKAEHQVWGREFVGPIVSLWNTFRHPHPTTFVFLLAAFPAVIGVLRRLPLAYGLYVLTAIAVAISYPTKGLDPLTSLPRYMVVLFPMGMWLAAWLTEHPRLRTPVLILSALAMSVFVARFATWHWAQ